jgi:TonB family protein
MKLTMTALALALTLFSGASSPAQNTGASSPDAAPVQTVAPAPRMVRISGAVAAGNILTKVQPVYPPDAKAQGISGSVVLHAVIGKDGTVQELTAVTGNELLRSAALDAVRQWTYKPLSLNGNPVAVDTTVTINFNLAGQTSTPLTSGAPVTEKMSNGDTETIKVVNQTAPAASAAPLSVARVSGGVMAGNILTKVMPIVPQEARAQHIGGTVVLRVLIGKDGKVISAEPKSGPEVWRQPCADALKQWTYKPFLLNGNPVEVDTTMTCVSPNMGAL